MKTIRIYNYECARGIEKSVLRIMVWHHTACREMNNADPKGRIFHSHPHTNTVFFFLLTIKFPIFYFLKRLPEVPEYTEIQLITLCCHINITLTLLDFKQCNVPDTFLSVTCSKFAWIRTTG